MKERLEKLKSLMAMRGYDAYVVFTSDDHGSEYIEDHFKSREFFSGFTGSAGTLVVTKTESRLWTDGRYFLQAERQLKASGTLLMKDGEEGVVTVIEYLKSLGDATTVALDFTCTSTHFANALKKELPNVKLVDDGKIVDEIWLDRPELPLSKAYLIDDENAGESAKSKLATLLADAKKQGSDFALVSSLDDVAWLFNLRGDDIRYNPVNYAYALVGDGHAILYIDSRKLSAQIANKLAKDGVFVRPYDAVYDDVKALRGKVLIDESKLNYALSLLVADKKCADVFPTTMRKAVKNAVEIENSKKAQLEDSVAMTKFMRWLKENVGKIKMDEIGVADKLEAFRRESDRFVELSFDTICGYLGNGAIIHYSATEETNSEIFAKGLLLVDSGAQYLYGTTDITRTFALGELSAEMKHDFTLVLKSHIALSTANFSENTFGVTLDAIARAPMAKEGKNFNHGTGHGVGYLLNVHEGPHNVSPRMGLHPAPLKAGVFVTDEPGIYIENAYGIRHENVLLCTKAENGELGFEPITLVPFDIDAINADELDERERAWLNAYHKRVFDTVSPLLDEDDKKYLAKITREI